MNMISGDVLKFLGDGVYKLGVPETISAFSVYGKRQLAVGKSRLKNPCISGSWRRRTGQRMSKSFRQGT